MVLFFGAVRDPDVRGRPLRLAEAAPARKERADCRRAISASMAEMMSCVIILVTYQRLGQIVSYVCDKFKILCGGLLFGLSLHYTLKTIWLRR
jgi:hypothetical protein